MPLTINTEWCHVSRWHCVFAPRSCCRSMHAARRFWLYVPISATLRLPSRKSLYLCYHDTNSPSVEYLYIDSFISRWYRTKLLAFAQIPACGSIFYQESRPSPLFTFQCIQTSLFLHKLVLPAACLHQTFWLSWDIRGLEGDSITRDFILHLANWS